MYKWSSGQRKLSKQNCFRLSIVSVLSKIRPVSSRCVQEQFNNIQLTSNTRCHDNAVQNANISVVSSRLHQATKCTLDWNVPPHCQPGWWILSLDLELIYTHALFAILFQRELIWRCRHCFSIQTEFSWTFIIHMHHDTFNIPSFRNNDRIPQLQSICCIDGSQRLQTTTTLNN